MSLNLIFFGPPGCGKGTYASRVAPVLCIPHISTGDIFRSEIERGSELGKKVAPILKSGNLVPDDITIQIIEKRLKQPDCKKGFIFDGYPRTIEQMTTLEKITKIDIVINFQLAEEILLEKALARRVCKNCGKIYNVADISRNGIHLPPLLPKKSNICDNCGGELIHRKDDNEKTFKDRQNVYKTQSKLLLEYYRKKGLVKDLDVIGAPEIMVPIIINTIKKNVKV